MRAILLTAAAAVGLGFLGAELAKAQEKSPPTVETLWPSDLWHAYHENAIAADAKYRGKAVALKITAAVRRDLQPVKGGGYQIGLHIVQGKFPPSLIGRIAPDAEKGFASLTDGSEGQIIAEVVGRKEASGAFKSFIIELKNARFVPKDDDGK